MRSFLWFAPLLLLGSSLAAQSFTDALRYSFVTPQGSARFAGTGGALTPMGVDYTTTHTNPAGIGWNRNSTVHVSPGFAYTNTESVLLNGSGNPASSAADASFLLGSAGVIFAGTTRSPNWTTLNFSFGASRMADFNQTVDFVGRSERSIVDAIVDDLNFARDNPELGESFPYRADLILQIPDALLEDEQGFFSDFDLEENIGGQIRREGLIRRSGGMTELAFGFGGNYRDRLLWGFSLGIPYFRYEEVYEYDEIDDQGEITSFDNAAFDQDLQASGTGFNLKFGLTYLPVPEVRVGVYAHSPTFWTIEEEYFTDLTYNFTLEGEARGGTARSDLLLSNYNLQTPWRFGLGGGALIGKAGFVSIDVDYADYAGNSISFDDFATEDEATNQDIDDILGGSLGIRIGGELNVKPLQVRAGIGYRQVPFQNFVNDEDEAILTYSAGLGYSRGKFFVDLAGQYSGYATFQPAYQTFGLEGQTVTTDRIGIVGILTVGVRGFNLGR